MTWFVNFLLVANYACWHIRTVVDESSVWHFVPVFVAICTFSYIILKYNLLIIIKFLMVIVWLSPPSFFPWDRVLNWPWTFYGSPAPGSWVLGLGAPLPLIRSFLTAFWKLAGLSTKRGLLLTIGTAAEGAKESKIPRGVEPCLNGKNKETRLAVNHGILSWWKCFKNLQMKTWLWTFGGLRILPLPNYVCPLFSGWSYFLPYLHAHIQPIRTQLAQLDSVSSHTASGFGTQGAVELDKGGRKNYLQYSPRMITAETRSPCLWILFQQGISWSYSPCEGDTFLLCL